MSLTKLSARPKVNKILLSIKPKFIEEIKKGNKKFEYRKTIFKNTDIDTVVIYASSPISKAIGEFKIKNILVNNPKELWRQTSNKSGITLDFFNEYFSNKDKGYALEISELVIYKEPIDIFNKFGLIAPQSFCYIK